MKEQKLKDFEIFNSEEFGEVRVVVVDDKPYFEAICIAEVLGYKKPHNSIERHCRYATKWGVPHPQSKTKLVEKIFIPEEDVISLISRSLTVSTRYKSSLIEFLRTQFDIDVDKVIPRCRNEIEFKELFEGFLKGYGYSLICQYPISGYKLDFYIPELNTAIEYDEIHHKNAVNTREDKRRECDIRDALGCNFFRICESEEDSVNLGLIANFIQSTRPRNSKDFIVFIER